MNFDALSYLQSLNLSVISPGSSSSCLSLFHLKRNNFFFRGGETRKIVIPRVALESFFLFIYSGRRALNWFLLQKLRTSSLERQRLDHAKKLKGEVGAAFCIYFQRERNPFFSRSLEQCLPITHAGSREKLYSSSNDIGIEGKRLSLEGIKVLRGQ